MSPMKSWSRFRIMRSVGERRTAGRRRIDAKALENIVATATARLQPDLVQPQDVFVRVGVRSLAHLVQRIDHWLKLLGQLAEHAAQYPAPATRQCFGEGRVRTSAHGDV